MNSCKIFLFILMVLLTIASRADPSELALLVSGEELGYLESSGCEGVALAGMKKLLSISKNALSFKALMRL